MYVIGTAGHVDHGKSTLVKALTDIDPDRLPEEKEREMTVDLGFAWMTLPSGRECRHNTDYWLSQPYLGQPAWERLDGQHLGGALTVGGWKRVSHDTACSERMFLGLCLLDGLDLTQSSTAVDTDLSLHYQTQIQALADLGLLEQQANLVRLTKSAYLIANQAFTRFLD